jgi:GntR family transcriptional repressor for pyruvate dehydrogenase complex
MRLPRAAEIVADELRSEILRSGTNGSGRLPPQDELLARFEVGLPSIREALRILEVEGLITVHRGNVGGATVRLPDAYNVAYMVGMVLESRTVDLRDVAITIRRLEPICAEMCAENATPATIAALRALVEDQRASIDDPPRFNSFARAFHSAVVEECGNASMAVSVGSLVHLWTAHEQSWTELATTQGRFPGGGTLKKIVDVHEKLLDAIEAGDPKAAARISGAHLEAAQTYHLSVDTQSQVLCAPLRYTERPAKAPARAS